MTTVDIDHLQQWVGRTEVLTDLIHPMPMRALAATLDRDDEPVAGAALPPPWHWVYFVPVVALAQVGPDGHPQRGGFLPPVPLPRRMWAGSRLSFDGALTIGSTATRTSTITDVQAKTGKTGTLVFVTVQHVYTRADEAEAGAVVLREEQDLVYRDDPRPGDPAPAPRAAPVQAAWRREVHPDPVLLFRYSALTFNGHRIHYDHPYATGVEGYAGLVVHGPLIATLLLDLVRRSVPAARIAQFDFRAVRPIICGTPFAVCGEPAPDGKTVALWAQDDAGHLCMQAQATLA